MAADSIQHDKINKMFFDIIDALKTQIMPAATSERPDISLYFDTLASSIKDLFCAEVVSVWAYSKCNDLFILHGSAPKREKSLATNIIPAKDTFTAQSLHTTTIIINRNSPDIPFYNRALLDYYKINYMTSLKVNNISDDSILYVINIYFKSEPPSVLSDNVSFREAISFFLNYAIYYLYNQITRKIKSTIYKIAPYADGVNPLFEAVRAEILKFTGCRTYLVYKYIRDESRIERITIDDTGYSLLSYNTNESINNVDLTSDAIRTCLLRSFTDKSPYILKENMCCISDKLSKTKATQFYCRHIASPILSLNGDVLAIIYCGNPASDVTTIDSHPLSSLDSFFLAQYAKYLQPHLERFLLHNPQSLIMRVVRDVALAMSKSFDLKGILSESIQRLCTSMNANIGSIYLPDEHNKLWMRAGFGSNETLVDKAFYDLSGSEKKKGITVEIFRSGRIINLKSRDEVVNHEFYLGKYDNIIHSSDTPNMPSSFLGVPIKLEDTILGVWKLTRLSCEGKDKNIIFTDEDERAAQILSSLFAYAIANKHQEDKIHHRSRVLAQTLKIENSQNEDDAIQAVLSALEESHFDGASLYKYDAHGSSFSKDISFGFDPYVNKFPEHDFIDLLDSKETLVDGQCRQYNGDTICEYILPLKVVDEFLGILLIFLNKSSHYGHDVKTLMEAFAGHLSIAISRMRYIQRSLDIADEIMRNSRFIVAESMSGVALHSLRHQLEKILNELEIDVNRKEIKEREYIYTILMNWNRKLVPLFQDISALMSFVRKSASESINLYSHAHIEIQKCIEMWLHLLREHHCRIHKSFDACVDHIQLAPFSFREILSIFLINSIQAFAKNITISTSVDNDYYISCPDIFIVKAFIVEVSDDGSGILNEDFEAMFSSTYSTKPDKFGTGLGLFIARRLALKSGGWVEYGGIPKNGRGAIFRLSLPVVGGQRCAT